MYILAAPFANLLLLLYHFLGHNTVLAIAALTVLINLLLFPLTLSQQKQAHKMQALQPELEKLKKKYGKDQERLAQEQMKLYKEMGINPFGGCLPILIQMPIWFSLYRAIIYCVPTTPLQLFQFSQQIYRIPLTVGLVPLKNSFLGMDLGLPPNAAQWWSYALPVLVFVTSLVQQKLLTPPSTGDDNSQAALMNRQMQIMMPLMFMLFTLQYATGLSIYFIISNLIRIAEFYLIRVNHKGQSPAKTIR